MDSKSPPPSVLSGLTEAEQIQCAYPSEPEWRAVSDQTLVDLVETYFQEPSCATIAIGLLKSRHHASANALARWLLFEVNADQWLKARASEVLEEIERE